MINQQTVSGAWDEAKGKMKQRWGELTDNELEQAQGSLEQVAGYIQRKTGESREAIQEYLDQIGAVDAWNQAKDSISEMASTTAETIQKTAQQASDQVKAGYIQTQRFVRQRPIESLAVTLGVGIIAGVITGLVLKSR